MFCPFCGSPAREGASFCSRCGRPIPQAPPHSAAPAGKRRRPVWPFLLLSLLLLVGLGFLFRNRLPLAEDLTERIRGDVREQLAGEVPAAEAAAPTAAALIPHFSDRYYLSRLSDEDLALFCAIYEAVNEHEDSCVLPAAATEEQLKLCWYLLQFECPELFLLDYSRPLNYSRGVNLTLALQPNYVLSERDYRSALRDCRAVLDEIAAAAEGLDAAGREALAFRTLADFCRYDTQASFCATAYGALIGGEAKCDGISLALKWCLEELGIPSLIVTGESREDGVGHAWNMVHLDGEWANVDLTPSVRRSDESDGGFGLIYHSFNVSDAWMAQDYAAADAPEGAARKPVCRTMAQSWYALRGEFVAAGEDPFAYLAPQLRQIAAEGSGRAQLQFESRTEAEAFFAGLDEELRSWSAREMPGASLGAFSGTLLNSSFLILRFAT